MKRITILTAAAALIMGTVSAQDFGSQQRPERKQFTPEQIAERRVESLGKTLELTDEQKKEIYDIYLANAVEQQQEMEAMRKAMQQREKQQARQKVLDEKMQKILDASQYKKWSKQQQAMQSRGRFPAQGGFQRPGGGEGGFGGPGQGGGFDNGMGF